MIRNVRDLRHVAVNASDGRIGFVEQVFFDDEKWTIRYLVVDTDKEFGDRRVLVSPLAVTSLGVEALSAISVRHTRRQVADSPDIDTEKPVSRQKEIEYNRYYVLPTYWGAGGLWGAWTIPTELLSLPPQSPSAEKESVDVHLRSSREVIGYRVKARDRGPPRAGVSAMGAIRELGPALDPARFTGRNRPQRSRIRLRGVPDAPV
jgi:hypothetical protein